MFIDQETRRRVNIYAPYKGFSKLDTPEIRERVGVMEIPDPVRMPDETHYNQEINESPYLICTPKSVEMLARQAQEKLNRESLAYLANTDWMVTRLAENGTAIPVNVIAARQAARDAIVHLEPHP